MEPDMNRPGQNLQTNTVTLFPSTEAFFDAVIGPREPNQHVIDRNWHLRREGQKAAADRFSEMMVQDAKVRRETRAQEIAEQHNFNPTTIRAALHRYEFGCFSKWDMAPTQTVIHRRALDIALDRAAFAQAAE
jgi:hypothetical protein